MYKQGEFGLALYAFREALARCDSAGLDCPVIRQNVANARAWIDRKQAEAARLRQLEQAKMAEAARQRQLGQAQQAIGAMLDGLASKWGASGSRGGPGSLTFARPDGAAASGELVFIAPGARLFEKGTKRSAPVDLTFVDPNKPAIVDPRVVRGAMSPEEAAQARQRDEKARAEIALGAMMAQRGDFDQAIRYFENARATKPDDDGIKKALGYVLYLRDRGLIPPNPKVEALLDALELGAGDWRASVDYLTDLHRTDPLDLGVRDALNFAEGMSGYATKQPTAVIALQSDPAALNDPATKRLVDEAIVYIGLQDWWKAYYALKEAHEVHPEDIGIRDTMNFIEGVWAAQQ